jgi:hypothetical protein
MEHKKITPLFFFLSLGTVVALIASVSAFLNLAFETLNHALPDVLTDSFTYGYANYSYSGVRSALALLIIIFPVYLVLERFWSSAGRKSDLFKGNEILRRWAIYLILFLSSITAIVDLVVLVRYFVSGEITTRFILKVAITLIAAGIAGWYYIREISLQKERKWFGIIGSILVVGVIIWSFSVIGSPFHQRKLRIDQRRVDDLQSIQWQVISYWQQKEKLPAALTDISTPLSGFVIPQDPEFQKGRVYEYAKTGDKSFELCATFDLPMPKGWVPGSTGGVYPMAFGGDTMRDVAVSAVAPYPGVGGDSWDHDAGYKCFARTIDPDVYPPFPKTKGL